MSKYKILFVLALCLPASASFAAGPYFVDDADIVDPGTIQTENWFSHSSKNESIVTDDVAYQLLPHAEFTLLNAYDRQGGKSANDTLSAQTKYQWREGDEGKNIASSAVLGMNYSTNNRFAGMYAYIPSTWAINDVVNVNADLGWQYTAASNRYFATWGIGTELHASKTLSFIGEVFSENTDKPALQVGSHIGLSENFILDLVYGYGITGTPANWLTAGLTATF